MAAIAANLIRKPFQIIEFFENGKRKHDIVVGKLLNCIGIME